MYLLYDSFGFSGIYVFTLIISVGISIVLFNCLLKEKNGLILSFFVTLFAIYSSKSLFTARNQIFSFLIFLLEAYYLNELLERGNKKGFWILLLLAFCLVNVHDTVYPLYFVIILPYIAEIFMQKILKLDSSSKIQFSNFSNKKYLIILIVLAFFIGFCTPIFGTSYTNLVNCMNGVSTNFILELQPVNIFENYRLTFLVFLFFAILCFTKTKVKLKDLLFVIGFLIFSLMTKRNAYFMYLIGIISYANIITSFLGTYFEEEERIKYFEKLENSKLFIITVCCIVLLFSISKISYQLTNEYVYDSTYPKRATKWIKDNLDYEDIRIWTHFNWGSYLELNGIKVFVDSRSGMYTEQENKDCKVLIDWLSVVKGKKNYETIFKKYDISHVLVENDELINIYISKDENYKVIYEDDDFSLYEKVNVTKD